MRVLALDPGTVRLGVAVSDELQMIAQPLEFIPADPAEALFVRIQHLLQEKAVGLILVGMPRNMDGSYGPAAEQVRAFIEKLSARTPVPIRTWDERLTSVMANRALLQGNVRRADRRRKVDQTAAAILLQSYLDAQSSGPTE